jgi:ABC-type multidrug transport system ATPase subunit
VELADRILRMDRGRIVAAGTHAELLATDPEYVAMLSAYDAVTPNGEDRDVDLDEEMPITPVEEAP